MFRQKLFDIVSCIHFRKTCDLMLEISKIRFIVIRYRSNDALKNWIEFLSNASPNLLIVFPRKNPSSPLPLDKKWQFFFRTRDRCNERFRENSSIFIGFGGTIRKNAMTQCVACYRGGFCRPKPVVEPRVCTLFPFVDKVRCTGGVMDLTKMEWNGKNVGGICLLWNTIAEVFKSFSGFNLWPWILIVVFD